MKQIMNTMTIVGALGLLVTLLSFNSYYQDKKWVVPEAAKKAKSPVKFDGEAVEIGKGLYAKHCKSCHGKNGEGDGPKAKELDTPLSDFTTTEVQGQSDGELYYKTTEGRDDMPSFKKKIASEEDRWMVIAFMRTLKK